MRIETYTEQHKEDVIRLIREFYDESISEYQQGFELDALYKAIEEYRQHSFLLIIDGRCEGVIAGKEVATPFSSERVFHEIVWFVSKPHRLKGVFLLNQAMKTLKEIGFTQIVMTLMHNSKTDKLWDYYTRLDFKAFETHFIKKL